MPFSQIENPLENPKEKRAKKLLKLFLFQVFIVFAVVVFVQRDDVVSREVPLVVASAEEADESGVVRADADENAPKVDFAVAKSENFRAGQIVFAGESDFLLDEADPRPLAIDGIRGEITSKKGRKEVQLVVIWKTNKPTSGEVRYGKNRSDMDRRIIEDTYGTNHGVVIPNLEPGTTYLYAIHAKDRFGNDATSEKYALFTGAEQLSIVDLIGNAVKETFSWAIRQ